GEARPPDDDAGEDAARADALPPPGAGELEAGIGHGEGAEDEAHLDLGEVEVARDGGGEDGDADAVEVGDGRQQHEKRGDAEADSGGRHELSLYARRRRYTAEMARRCGVFQVDRVVVNKGRREMLLLAGESGVRS